MKLRSLRCLQEKQQFVADACIVGIDPAKHKHQAQLIAPNGLPLGSSFSFPCSFSGFHHLLFRHLLLRMPGLSRSELPEHLLFAVETSLNLWQSLVAFLTAQGFRVVLVSPLTTHHERPARSGDFSRTDPKDAFLVASTAREGKFLFFHRAEAHARARHQLAITYHKLRHSLQQHYARLRAQVEFLFPEFLQILRLDTRSARYLLQRFVLPEDFLQMDLDRVARELRAHSQNQHGRATLERLQALARQSIGIRKDPVEARAERLTLKAWLTLIDTLESEIQHVEGELIRLSRECPQHRLLTSLKGISDLLAALLLAELRHVERFRHWKQIERMAGLNLHVAHSGTYCGRRRITHLGNRRLRWVLYQMAGETSKYVPEVRAKYLRRRLAGSTKRTKNLVACLPQLLKLLLTLVRQERPYDVREDALREVERLEDELARHSPKRNRSGKPRGKPAQRETQRTVA